MSGPGATVIKVGGSLLRDEDEYSTVSGFLAPVIRAGPTWVVVSAAFGVTDALVR